MAVEKKNRVSYSRTAIAREQRTAPAPGLLMQMPFSVLNIAACSITISFGLTICVISYFRLSQCYYHVVVSHI